MAEAATAIIDFLFSEIDVNRIDAHVDLLNSD